ncbi:hypothetical protein ACFWTE_11930 [Nocardiopsis sp. NPDC058631]|uniref:hypothetical protein n=1 Tax=Nocardiopsis sp. NPDC058631 TaxID=3346566 RepID=UPI003659E7A0
MTGYHLRPSQTVLDLREEFPDFLICELHNDLGRPCFTATSTLTGASGQPELVVTAGADELRRTLTVLSTGSTQSGREGGES